MAIDHASIKKLLRRTCAARFFDNPFLLLRQLRNIFGKQIFLAYRPDICAAFIGLQPKLVGLDTNMFA